MAASFRDREIQTPAKETKRISAELAELSRQHADALKEWTYLGVTEQAYREYEQRRKRIGELTRRLHKLSLKTA